MGYGLYYIVGQANPVFYVDYMQPWTLIAQLAVDADGIGGKHAESLGDGRRSVCRGTGATAFLSGLNDAYQHQWTLSFQRQLPKGLILDIAYVGNRGVHLLRRFEGNPGKLVPGANANNVESRRTYSGFGSVTGFAGDGKSLYNALQLTVSRRFHRACFSTPTMSGPTRSTTRAASAFSSWPTEP